MGVFDNPSPTDDSHADKIGSIYVSDSSGSRFTLSNDRVYRPALHRFEYTVVHKRGIILTTTVSTEEDKGERKSNESL